MTSSDNKGIKKSCAKCGRMLPLEMFYLARSAKDGREPTCKECRRHGRSKVDENREMRAAGNARCACCGDVKAKVLFPTNPGSKIGIFLMCLECRKSLTEKTCSGCKSTKPISEFTTGKSWTDGLYPYCYECSKGIQTRNRDIRTDRPARTAAKTLAALFPDLAAEWHPTLNGALAPSAVAAQHNDAFWWQCLVHPDHPAFKMSPNQRVSKGAGCPKCVVPNRSRREVAIAFELLHFFNFDVDDCYPEVDGVSSVDIWIPTHRIAIEYDGGYWHRSPASVKKDTQKTMRLENAGIHIVRLRECFQQTDLPQIRTTDISCSKDEPIPALVAKVVTRIGGILGQPIATDQYLSVAPVNSRLAADYYRVLQKRSLGGRWSRKHEECVECGTTSRRHVGHGLCGNCFVKNRYRNYLADPNTPWASGFVACLRCTSTNKIHVGNGLCSGCAPAYQHHRKAANGNLSVAEWLSNVQRNRDRWSPEYDCCIECATTTTKHWAKGRCKNCDQLLRNHIAKSSKLGISVEEYRERLARKRARSGGSK